MVALDCFREQVDDFFDYISAGPSIYSDYLGVISISDESSVDKRMIIIGRIVRKVVISYNKLISGGGLSK